MKSSIEVLGARNEVTGSRIKYTSEQGTQILIDCGMYQGTGDDDVRNHRSLDDCNPEKLSGILLTHGHADHSGLLPMIAAKSKAHTFATFATRDLASIVLKNSDFLSDGKLYPKGSVDAALKSIVPVEYNTPINIDYGSTATFHDAGHVLGSASIEIQKKDKNKEIILFSGDIGNPNSRTVRPATQSNKGADIVLMETTYANRIRPTEDPVEVIMELIERVKKTGGTGVIPTFALDRSTNLGGIFKELSKKKILRTKNGKYIPIFFDGQMQYHATKIYGSERYRELLNDKLKEQGNVLDFPEMRITYRREESLAIRNFRGPKIIIPGGGMMIGGRVLGHAADYLPGKDNVFLLVGYSAEGTLARQIAEGQKKVYVKDYGYVDVDATVLQTSSMSAHADQKQLLDWLRHVQGGNRRLRKVILNHGDKNSQDTFADLVTRELGITDVCIPKENEPIFL